MYEIILADPPWQHSSTQGPTNRRAAERQYPTMSTLEIANLKVPAANNARLFLWCTDSMLLDALNVMQVWGFKYKKVAFVWVKVTSGEHVPSTAIRDGIWDEAPRSLIYTPAYGWRKLTFGAGRTTRNGAELCLLGVRGRLDVDNHSQRQVVIAPVREHSRKPDEVAARIEAMYPNWRYLEMFARERRPGWDAWGNEVGKFS